MKVLTHIDCPKEWDSESDFDSHRPLLYLAVENCSDGWVVEYGSGYGSTGLLRKNCEWFWSFETNEEWAKRTGADFIDNYFKSSQDGVLLFIDCAPAWVRKYLIGKYSHQAMCIVIHDTEPGAEYVYGMSEILSTFKHRIDYRPEGKPHTTAVSNFIDVEKWVE